MWGCIKTPYVPRTYRSTSINEGAKVRSVTPITRVLAQNLASQLRSGSWITRARQPHNQVTKATNQAVLVLDTGQPWPHCEEAWPGLLHPLALVLWGRNCLPLFCPPKGKLPRHFLRLFHPSQPSRVCVPERRASTLLVAEATWYSGEVQS